MCVYDDVDIFEGVDGVDGVDVDTLMLSGCVIWSVVGLLKPKTTVRCYFENMRI